MVIILCTCNWGIPGIEELPPHYHYRHTRVLVCRDGCEQQEIWFTSPVLPQAGFRILEEHEEIHISVPWKQVAKALGEVIAENTVLY